MMTIVLSFSRLPSIETNRLIGKEDAEAVFAIDREIVFDPDAAVIANPERHGFPAPILREFVRLVFEARISNSHVSRSTGPRRRIDRQTSVKRSARRRYCRDSDFDVLGKNVLRLDVNADERLYRSGILRAIHSLNRHIPGLRSGGMAVETGLQPSHQRVDILLFRLLRCPEEASGGPAVCERPFPRLRDVRKAPAHSSHPDPIRLPEWATWSCGTPRNRC